MQGKNRPPYALNSNLCVIGDIQELQVSSLSIYDAWISLFAPVYHLENSKIIKIFLFIQ